MNIYLDIETIPTQRQDIRDLIASTITPPGTMSKPETIAKWEAEQKPFAIEERIRQTALDACFGEVWCIAWAVGDGPVEILTRSDPTADYGEVDLLRTWINATGPFWGRATWTGHNVKAFDLPFLARRLIVNQLCPPEPLPWADRGDDQWIADTMTMWAGWKDRVSLDTLCRALRIDGKPDDIDGSRVWEFVQAGKWREVGEYCKSDVERTRQVYKRLTFQP